VEFITLIVFQALDFNRQFKDDKYTQSDTTESIITRMQISVMFVKDVSTRFPTFCNTRISLANLSKRLILDFKKTVGVCLLVELWCL
jgi:predicted lactoylglutathione lyase